VVKTRTLAQKLAVSGRVRVNRAKCDSASDIVKVGDVLTIALDRSVRLLKVTAPGTRRGGPGEARQLYQDLSPPPEPANTAQVTAPPMTREPGSGRPTKRDQRRLSAMKSAADDDFS
jgi:ribosome-associated heat shock protein Hsp15